MVISILCADANADEAIAKKRNDFFIHLHYLLITQLYEVKHYIIGLYFILVIWYETNFNFIIF